MPGIYCKITVKFKTERSERSINMLCQDTIAS